MTRFKKQTLILTALASFAALTACAPPHSDHNHSHASADQSENTMTPSILQQNSPHSFEQTVERLRAEIGKRPLNLFAEVPHSKGAEKVGLDLAPMTLFIFGNPKGGTPLILRSPQMGMELPLKVLVYQTDDGVKVDYTDIAALVAVHGQDPQAQPTPNVAAMLDGLVGAVVAN